MNRQHGEIVLPICGVDGLTVRDSERCRMGREDLAVEAGRLRAAWMRHDSWLLDRYLVSDVEDPRINLQSILSRAFLIDSLWPNEFTSLIREEFRFSICLNWILRALKVEDPEVSRELLLDALLEGRPRCGDVVIPSYLTETFESASRAEHPWPDYVTEALMQPALDQNAQLPESALSIFERIWHDVLAGRDAKRISVLEPACGSANDYRYLHSFGVSRFLDYTGLDICDKNIANARRRFPNAGFQTEDFIAADFEAKSYDFLFVHDLFEHLCPEGIERALAQVARVTRKQACLSFFNMADIPEHAIEPKGLYHWNRLSLTRIQDSLLKSASTVDPIHITSFLQGNYECPDHHNPTAYTLIVSFDCAC